MVVISPWLSSLHGCHLSMVVISPWLSSLHGCHLSMVVISPWLSSLHGCHLSMVVISPWLSSLHGCHLSMVVISPWLSSLHGCHLSRFSSLIVFMVLNNQNPVILCSILFPLTIFSLLISRYSMGFGVCSPGIADIFIC